MKLLHNDNSGDQLFLHCSNLEQRDFMIDVGSSGMLLTIVRIFLKIKIFHIIHIYLHIRFSLLNNICPTTSIQGAVEWTWIWRGALTLFPPGRYQNRNRTPPTQKLFLFFYFFHSFEQLLLNEISISDVKSEKGNSNLELGTAICYINVENYFLTIIKHITVPSSKLELPFL